MPAERHVREHPNVYVSVTNASSAWATGGLVDLALGAGAVTVRRAKMEPDQRYKINGADESHPVVYINRDLDRTVLIEAIPEIEHHLADLERLRRRRSLLPVPELVGDEPLPGEATGTDGMCSDSAARLQRRSIGAVPDLA